MSDGFNFDFNADSADLLGNLFKSIGLWDGDELTISDWNLNNALNFFMEAERIESVLDILANLTGLPSMYYRLREEARKGIVVSDSPIGSRFIEEWFPIYSFPLGEGSEESGAYCKLNLTTINKKSDDPGDPGQGHLNLGMGF